MKHLRLELLPYQMQMVKSTAKYLGFIGGTGTGKSFMIPTWLLSKMSQHPGNEWIVSAPTTMMLKRTVLKYLIDDFKTWGVPFEINKSDLVVETPLGIIYFISAETPDRMQGVHPKGIIGDEAGLYDRLWWQTAIQRVSFRSGQIFLTTTPYDPNHWLKLEFWDRWKAGDPNFEIVNPISLDNPFYPEDEYWQAKRRLPKWRFDLLYNAKFPEQSDNALFKVADLRRVIDIEAQSVIDRTEDEELYMTIDVAREGTDESVICLWRGYVLEEIHRYETNTLTELVASAHVLSRGRESKITYVVDSSGLGAGVYDMLYEQGLNAYGVNFAQRADDEAYANARAEMYHNLAKAVEDETVKLLDDDYLIDDLIVQERTYNSRGQIALVLKEKIKEKIGRSPDVADAVALRFSAYKPKVGII